MSTCKVQSKYTYLHNFIVWPFLLGQGVHKVKHFANTLFIFPLNLICNIPTFEKNVLTFYPTSGVEGV